jgi:hypothetical protein
MSISEENMQQQQQQQQQLLGIVGGACSISNTS